MDECDELLQEILEDYDALLENPDSTVLQKYTPEIEAQKLKRDNDKDVDCIKFEIVYLCGMINQILMTSNSFKICSTPFNKKRYYEQLLRQNPDAKVNLDSDKCPNVLIDLDMIRLEMDLKIRKHVKQIRSKKFKDKKVLVELRNNIKSEVGAFVERFQKYFNEAKSRKEVEYGEIEVYDIMIDKLRQFSSEPFTERCPIPLDLSEKNKVSLEKDVIGLEDAKSKIKANFIEPLKYPKLFADVNRNTLLYGPPGTGKTFLVKAIASDPGLTNCIVYAPTPADIKGMYVGETEKAIKRIFTCHAKP